MNSFINLGFSIEEIQMMMNTNILIQNQPDDVLKEAISLLKKIGCQTIQIKNIIYTNPFYFNQDGKKVIKMIQYLEDCGITNIPVLLDMNPYLLNYSVEELKKIVTKNSCKEYLLDHILI